MRFHRYSILALLIAGAPAALAQVQVAPSSAPQVTERTFRLLHLEPNDAAKLVAPYVHSAPASGVYEAGNARAITVRETPQVLARIEALLREHDRAPVTVVLRFQLIAAESTQSRDPAIAAVESQLRTLFRFPGYRLLSEATAVATMYQDFHLLIPAGDERLELKGHLMSVNTEESEPNVLLRVSLERPTPVVDPASGSVLAGALLGTGLTVPIGQTVVMGSTTPGGKIQALILVVRPEIAAAKK